MKKVICDEYKNLDYTRIVMIYNNDSKQRYLAHAFLYQGRDVEYLMFLYKEPLEDIDFLTAWNKLDDESLKITIVPEESIKRSVDDFVAVWKPEYIMNKYELYEVNDFKEINEFINNQELKKDFTLFVMK